MENLHQKTVSGFGDEWSRFDQSELDSKEHQELFDSYFRIFPWDKLPANAVGFDLGAGSGRWAKLVAPRVGHLHLIDASFEALQVAKKNMQSIENCELHQASVESIPLPDHSMDFGYSLGVLHHVPETFKGIQSCVKKLKPGAPFLLYLYYSFDNRPLWFRLLWKLSDLIRQVVSRMPHGLRYIFSQILAGLVYWPLARFAKLIEKLGVNVSSFPLSFYRDKSFYVMRTDSLDRFGTRLEQRFSRLEIEKFLIDAGLKNIQFSSKPPFWTAVGIKK